MASWFAAQLCRGRALARAPCPQRPKSRIADRCPRLSGAGQIGGQAPDQMHSLRLGRACRTRRFRKRRHLCCCKEPLVRMRRQTWNPMLSSFLRNDCRMQPDQDRRHLCCRKEPLVPEERLELSRLAAGDFESPASTIPPLGPDSAPTPGSPREQEGLPLAQRGTTW